MDIYKMENITLIVNLKMDLFVKHWDKLENMLNNICLTLLRLFSNFTMQQIEMDALFLFYFFMYNNLN